MAVPLMFFGSDPEFMLVDGNGELKSAITILHHGKEDKIDLGGGNKVFYDNVLLELNIAPFSNLEKIENSFRSALYGASRTIGGHCLRARASAIYPSEECEHEDAKIFGCEPEYCAYDLTQITPPVCEENNTFRSAGGHIHLGFKGQYYPLMASVEDSRYEREWGRIWVVRMLDLFVGLPSILLDRDPTSAARRKLYGHAGTHRPKEEYGVEYRAPGNFWLASPKLLKLMYRLCLFAVNFTAERKYSQLWSDTNTCIGYDVAELRDCIDNSKSDVAKKLLENIVKPLLSESLFLEIFIMCENDTIKKDLYKDWGIL